MKNEKNPSLHVCHTKKAKPKGPETVTFSLLSSCSPKLFLSLSHDFEFAKQIALSPHDFEVSLT